jgi:hypothetical protein
LTKINLIEVIFIVPHRQSEKVFIPPSLFTDAGINLEQNSKSDRTHQNFNETDCTNGKIVPKPFK